MFFLLLPLEVFLLCKALINTQICFVKWRRIPVEVHFVNFWVVVFNLGVHMVNEDGEVGQAALHWECLGKAADVIANAIHQICYTWEKSFFQKRKNEECKDTWKINKFISFTILGKILTRI